MREEQPMPETTAIFSGGKPNLAKALVNENST